MGIEWFKTSRRFNKNKMKKLVIILLLFSSCAKSQLAGSYTGAVLKSTLHNLLLPTAGTLLVDTGSVSGYRLSWAQESTIFYDAAAGHTKIYFTAGRDSLGITAYVERLWLITTTDFITYSTPIPVLGMGYGGTTPATRRVTSSWVGKIGNTYYALGLNGYASIGFEGNVYGYTSMDGVTWTDKGIKINKATAWSYAFTGFGNTGICVDEFNNPVFISGKYQAIVDVWTGVAWRSFRATSDSLMGNWILTDSLASLIDGIKPLSAQPLYKNGKYYAFCFHDNLPSTEVFAYSSNCINWTIKEAPYLDNIYNPYTTGATAQIADPSFCEINGRCYHLSEYTNGSPPYPSQLRIWTYNGTFAQMLTQLF